MACKMAEAEEIVNGGEEAGNFGFFYKR